MPPSDYAQIRSQSFFTRSVALDMRFRAERGLSQEELANECGINRTYLSSVERSERNVSIDNIARIAKGLQIEPWRLLKDD